MNVDPVVRHAPPIDRVAECQRQRAAIRDHEIDALKEVAADAGNLVYELACSLEKARSDLAKANARLSVLQDEKSKEVQP